MSENKEENNKEKLKNIEGLPSRSGNKTLYLVTVEDPFCRTKKRVFVSRYLTQNPFGIDFVGYEVSHKTTSVLSEEDAVNLANKGNKELISVLFPWHRIVSIKNTSYKEAKHIKNTINQTIIGE